MLASGGHMNILFLLIPLGLLLLGIAVWAFFWAVGSGQFDDLDSPAWSVLMDDDQAPEQDGNKRAKSAERQ
jgi:cbb3-type cytochrome oxidase maturation protein